MEKSRESTESREVALVKSKKAEENTAKNTVTSFTGTTSSMNNLAAAQSEVTHLAWKKTAVFLAVGTFVVGTDAYVIAGILPDMARSLQLRIGQVGQLVTVFSLAYAILAPILAVICASWSRKLVLTLALIIFSLGNAGTALAGNYIVLLLTRLIAAAGAALYTPNAGVLAATLAGERNRGKAFSIVTMGLSTSLVFGAPLGSWIGHSFGWKITMWCVALAGLLALFWLIFVLPDVQHVSLNAAVTMRERLAPIKQRAVFLNLVVTMILFLGIFMPYTYISQVYSPLLQHRTWLLSIFLLFFGLAGTGGSLYAGKLSDRFPVSYIVITVSVLLAVMDIFIFYARQFLPAALVVIVISGWLSWSILAPQQRNLIALAPHSPAFVISLNASAVYIGVSLSGLIGAWVLEAWGPSWISGIAALILLVGSGYSFIVSRLNFSYNNSSSE